LDTADATGKFPPHGLSLDFRRATAITTLSMRGFRTTRLRASRLLENFSINDIEP
jgi:hypothetical protein